MVAGIFTAKGIALAFTALGFALPAGGTVVNSSTIVISMVVGTLVTVSRRTCRLGGRPRWHPSQPCATSLSTAPARRCAAPSSATVVTVAGAAFIALGLSGGAIAAVGLGAVSVFVGVAVLGPVIARPFTKVLGAPLPRLRGMAGTVARQNDGPEPAS